MRFCTPLKRKGGLLRRKGKRRLSERFLVIINQWMYGILDHGLLRRRVTSRKQILERNQIRVANEGWITLFPNAMVHHLPHSFSDHYPLLIQLEQDGYNLRPKCFHFEAWWVLEETFEQVVRNLQEEGDDDILIKLERVRASLGRWAMETR